MINAFSAFDCLAVSTADCRLENTCAPSAWKSALRLTTQFTRLGRGRNRCGKLSQLFLPIMTQWPDVVDLKKFISLFSLHNKSLFFPSSLFFPIAAMSMMGVVCCTFCSAWVRQPQLLWCADAGHNSRVWSPHRQMQRDLSLPDLFSLLAALWIHASIAIVLAQRDWNTNAHRLRSIQTLQVASHTPELPWA